MAARILLVDDEQQLLSLLERYLKRMGLSVCACERSLDALQQFEAEPDTFDLVVADLAMPDLPGDELIKQILTRNPVVKGLLCSGSPYTLSKLPGALRSRLAFLQKPFSPAMLASAVESLLHPSDPA